MDELDLTGKARHEGDFSLIREAAAGSGGDEMTFGPAEAGRYVGPAEAGRYGCHAPYRSRTNGSLTMFCVAPRFEAATIRATSSMTRLFSITTPSLMV